MHSTVFERIVPDPRVVSRALAGSRLAPFWLDGVGAPAFPRYSGTGEWDLAIVGGGYTGLWAALIATQRHPGLRVVVLEGRRVGSAASGRNGGFVESTLTHGESNGRTRFADEYDELERLGLQNLDEIEATVGALGLDCDFERPGSLTVATEEYQLAELQAAHDGHDALFFDAASTRARVDSPTYLGSLLSTRTTALVHPGKLAVALARACTDAGVEFFENSPVLGIDSELPGAPVTLTLGGGFVRADRVVLATNAFPSLLKRFRLHTVPVYDYVLMTEPLTRSQLASIGWRGREGLSDPANQFHYYRLSADNRILWGGYDAIYHYGGRIRSAYENRPATFAKLASHFFTTFPQLEEVRFSHRWAGVIDTSTRFCAFYGMARQGRVAYAAGYTGLGVAATRFAAQVMLDRLWDESTERTELKMVTELPLPFPPEPAAWVGVQATRRALDAADHDEGRRNLFLRTLDTLGLGFDS
jgi:glycine/D-amino acid oxidase-like deaminating enzyme